MRARSLAMMLAYERSLAPIASAGLRDEVHNQDDIAHQARQRREKAQNGINGLHSVYRDAIPTPIDLHTLPCKLTDKAIGGSGNRPKPQCARHIVFYESQRKKIHHCKREITISQMQPQEARL